jgi:hypothetical protein
MKKDYIELNELSILHNKKRLENWALNRKLHYEVVSQEMREEIQKFKVQKEISKHFQEKIDIQQKIDILLSKLNRRDAEMFTEKQKIDEEVEIQQEKFIAQLNVDGHIRPNLVVKF